MRSKARKQVKENGKSPLGTKKELKRKEYERELDRLHGNW